MLQRAVLCLVIVLSFVSVTLGLGTGLMYAEKYEYNQGFSFVESDPGSALTEHQFGYETGHVGPISFGGGWKREEKESHFWNGFLSDMDIQSTITRKDDPTLSKKRWFPIGSVLGLFNGTQVKGGLANTLIEVGSVEFGFDSLSKLNPNVFFDPKTDLKRSNNGNGKLSIELGTLGFSSLKVVKKVDISSSTWMNQLNSKGSSDCPGAFFLSFRIPINNNFQGETLYLSFYPAVLKEYHVDYPDSNDLEGDAREYLYFHFGAVTHAYGGGPVSQLTGKRSYPLSGTKCELLVSNPPIGYDPLVVNCTCDGTDCAIDGINQDVSCATCDGENCTSCEPTFASARCLGTGLNGEEVWEDCSCSQSGGDDLCTFGQNTLEANCDCDWSFELSSTEPLVECSACSFEEGNEQPETDEFGLLGFDSSRTVAGSCNLGAFCIEYPCICESVVLENCCGETASPSPLSSWWDVFNCGNFNLANTNVPL